jgi:3-methylfumaryl-CoA hydratase
MTATALYSIEEYMTTNTSSGPDVISRSEICALPHVRRVAAMLDRNPDLLEVGSPLPRGWQFILLGADTKRSDLREDGFPGLGVPMPNKGLSRIMLGGRSVEFLIDIPIGADVQRMSAIENIKKKSHPDGEISIVDISHSLSVEGQLAIIEIQTYLLFPGGRARPRYSLNSAPAPSGAVATFVPDETLLFQYSALCFNSHKIHIDKVYAMEVEGFSGLVVNGGLITLLMTEFMRENQQVVMNKIKTKHFAPLYSGNPINIVSHQISDGWRLDAFDQNGILAVQMEVNIK